MKNSSRFEFSVLGVLLLFVVWFVVSKLVSSDLVFPGPEKVLLHSYRLLVEGKLLGPVGLTFLRAFFGMGLALLVGTILGFLMGLSERIYLLLQPLNMAIRSVPIVSWLSTVILAWGIGWRGVVFIVFVSLLPIVTFNVCEGVRVVDKKLVEMAKVYSLPKWKIFRAIYMGSVWPFLLSSLKLSIGSMWKVAIVAEYLIGETGLGVQIMQAKFYVNTTEVFSYTVVAVAFGLILEALFSFLWERGSFEVHS